MLLHLKHLFDSSLSIFLEISLCIQEPKNVSDKVIILLQTLQEKNNKFNKLLPNNILEPSIVSLPLKHSSTTLSTTLTWSYWKSNFSKYFNICFYDNEFKETRRIVGVEWYVSMERGISSGYKVVTEILTPYNSEEKKQNNESNYETYCINEILFQMVLEYFSSSQWQH